MKKGLVDSRGREERGDVVVSVPPVLVLVAQAAPVVAVAIAHCVVLLTLGDLVRGAQLILVFPVFWAVWTGRLVLRGEPQAAWLEDLLEEPGTWFVRPLLGALALWLTLALALSGPREALELLMALAATVLLPFVIPLVLLGPPHLAYFCARRVGSSTARWLPEAVAAWPVRIGLAALAAAVVTGASLYLVFGGPWAIVGAWYLGAMAAGAASAPATLLKTRPAAAKKI